MASKTETDKEVPYYAVCRPPSGPGAGTSSPILVLPSHQQHLEDEGRSAWNVGEFSRLTLLSDPDFIEFCRRESFKTDLWSVHFRRTQRRRLVWRPNT
jgi:hypothetical protein